MAFGAEPADALTPDRETRVTLNRYLPQIIQPLFTFDKDSSEFAKSTQPASILSNGSPKLEFVPGVGLQLRNIARSAANVFERTGAQTAYTGSLVALAPGFSFFDRFRQETLVDVAYTDAPLTGGAMLQKRVAASASWHSELTADAAAFPPPFEADDVTDIDRVLKTVDVHEPGTALQFYFFAPGAGTNTRTGIVRFYFTGPAGSDNVLKGFGQYCIKCLGDGAAILYERGFAYGTTTLTWARRLVFHYTNVVTSGAGYTITVDADAYQDCSTGSWKGRRISFGISQGRTGGAMIDLLIKNMITAIGGVAAGKTHDLANEFVVYECPLLTNEPVQPAPVRIDARRDCRIGILATPAAYETSGTLQDDAFTLPFIPTDDEPFYLEWYANIPTGCTAVAKLYDAATDTELADGTVTISDCLGGQKRYTVPGTFPSTYYVRLTLTGTGTKTPTVTKWRVTRAAVVDTPVATEVVFPEARAAAPSVALRVAGDVSIGGASDNPQSDTATVVLTDLKPISSAITQRSGTPIEIAVFKPSDNTLISVLHSGIIGRPDSQPFANADSSASGAYPSLGNFEVTMHSAGQWARVKRHLLPERMALWDQSAQKPSKVTDALTQMLEASGYLGYLDIPDKPIRLFGQSQEQLIVEPDTPVAELCQTLAHDYLGAYFIWDANAGTDGLWRLKTKPIAPYKILCRFVYGSHPGSLKIPVHLLSYGNATVDGETVPIIPMLREGPQDPGYRRHTEPPEGNSVTVYGAASSAVAAQGAGRLSQTWINFASYNALKIASGDPGYPDFANDPNALGEHVPIHIYDASLNTQGAVDFVCRRVAEYAGFARDVIRFKAPLIFVDDADDDLQTNVRPLRIGDAVQTSINSTIETWIVTRCSPQYTQDIYQTAEYELVTHSQITTYGIPMGALTPLKLEQKWKKMGARAATGLPKNARTGFAAARSVSVGHSQWMGLPMLAANRIQDIDPGSPTFGEFLFMVDYE